MTSVIEWPDGEEGFSELSVEELLASLKEVLKEIGNAKAEADAIVAELDRRGAEVRKTRGL
jgi:F0F1-type ATP synthase membrane subunit b/b'